MQGHFWHQCMIKIFMLFYVVARILFSMAAPIPAYFQDSDKVLKNFDQWEDSLKRYLGQQNQGYQMKEYKKLD